MDLCLNNNDRIGGYSFGQDFTITCISSSESRDLLFVGIELPSGKGGEIIIFDPFLSIIINRIRLGLLYS